MMAIFSYFIEVKNNFPLKSPTLHEIAYLPLALYTLSLSSYFIGK